MSTSEGRPRERSSDAHDSTGRPAADETGVERHAPGSANELWDHNAYGREDGNIGGTATSGATDTRDPRGGAPAYNIDAGDDDAVRHGDDAADDGAALRAPGESLSGPDATAGHAGESVPGVGEGDGEAEPER